jgi:hypothetical protein
VFDEIMRGFRILFLKEVNVTDYKGKACNTIIRVELVILSAAWQLPSLVQECHERPDAHNVVMRPIRARLSQELCMTYTLTNHNNTSYNYNSGRN